MKVFLIIASTAAAILIAREIIIPRWVNFQKFGENLMIQNLREAHSVGKNRSHCLNIGSPAEIAGWYCIKFVGDRKPVRELGGLYIKETEK